MRVGDSDSDSVHQAHSEEGTDQRLNSRGHKVSHYQQYATSPTLPPPFFMQQMQERGRLHVRTPKTHHQNSSSRTEEPDVVLSSSEGHPTANPDNLGTRHTNCAKVKESDDDDDDQTTPRGYAVGGTEPKKKKQPPPPRAKKSMGDAPETQDQESSHQRMGILDRPLIRIFGRRIWEQAHSQKYPPPKPDPDSDVANWPRTLEELNVKLHGIMASSNGCKKKVKAADAMSQKKS